VLAGVEGPEQPSQFLLGILAGAANGRRGDLAAAGNGSRPEAVAQLESAGRTLADMSGAAHLSLSLASFEAVEGDPVLVRAEFRVEPAGGARPCLKQASAVLTLLNGGAL
jgi:hypothetical protein